MTWREGTRGPQSSRFACLQTWAAQGWHAREQPERAAEWLLNEWPKGSSEPTKYSLAQLGLERPGLRRFAKLVHTCWRIEVDHRELKEGLGLDYFEGRQWLGWHHHVTLVTITYAFLCSEQAQFLSLG